MVIGMEGLMLNEMQNKGKVLDLRVEYDLDKTHFIIRFIPSIGGEKKEGKSKRISRQFIKNLLDEFAVIYRFYETVRSKPELRASEYIKITDSEKNVLSILPGKTTIEKLEIIGKKIFSLFPIKVRTYLREYRISNIIINSKKFLIPFELMHDGDSFLATRFGFYRNPILGERETPSISHKTKNLPGSVVFVTNPTKNLKAAEQEVTKIVDFFRSKKNLNLEIKEYNQEGASYNAITNIFPSHRLDIFHYSGHSLVTENDICFDLMDYPLSITDVSLHYPALFFLNMCEADITVQHKIVFEGYESLNFPIALMKQGAKACIATFWPIVDKSAAEFATIFYQQVINGESFGRALCYAKKVLAESSDPNDITWMSFVLYGNPINSYLNGISNKYTQVSDIKLKATSDEIEIEIPVSDLKPKTISDEIKEEIQVSDVKHKVILDKSEEEIQRSDSRSEVILEKIKKDKVSDIVKGSFSERQNIISLIFSKEFLPNTQEEQFNLRINKEFLEELITILGRADNFRLVELNKKSLTEIGSKLYSQLIPNPIQNKLNSSVSKIIEISLDSDLLQYPWELLYNGEQFLGLKYSIGRCIIQKNQKIETSCPDRGLREGVKFLIVGDPSNDQKSIKDEAIQLDKQLSKIQNVETKLLVGKEADSNNFIMELQKDYDFLHYCGNANFNVNNPEESGILLSDGILKISSINNILCSKPPILAFINARETKKEQAPTPLKYENKVSGLATSFLLNGINYIGSMWPTHDANAIKTELFFYYEVLKGQPIGEALRRAKESAYKRSKEKQLNWASYILYGDPTISLEKVKD